MSSILKALKKLEDDKAARRPDELKIDAEILRTDKYPRFSSASVLLTSILLMAGGSGATYLYLKHDSALERANQKPPALYRLNSAPAIVPSDIKTEQLPEAIVVVPAPQQKTGRTAANTGNTTSAKPVAVAKHAVPAKTLPAVSPAVSGAVTPVPYLRVNGIAFQGSGADSVAIVNGTPVSSGSTIEGVTVEEIRKDRVLFQLKGERFEIRLGQSNTPL